MGFGKWIGGYLGFVSAGPLGALVGFIVGALFDSMTDSSFKSEYNYTSYDDNQRGYSQQQEYEGQRNSFLISLLTLASYIIKADGKVMHSEMELVRQFLRQNFGEIAALNDTWISFPIMPRWG